MTTFDNEQLHRGPVHKRLGMSVAEHKPGCLVLSIRSVMKCEGSSTALTTGGCSLPSRTLPAPLASRVLRHVFRVHHATDMHVRYYRQPRGGPLRAEAEMVHKGRTLLSAECVVLDAENRVLIRSTATYTRISTQGLVVPPEK